MKLSFRFAHSSGETDVKLINQNFNNLRKWHCLLKKVWYNKSLSVSCMYLNFLEDLKKQALNILFFFSFRGQEIKNIANIEKKRLLFILLISFLWCFSRKNWFTQLIYHLPLCSAYFWTKSAINIAWKKSVFGVFLVCIQSGCGKIRTRKTRNTDTFQTV